MSNGHYTGQTTKPLVEVGSATDCWQWLGGYNKKTGYGKKQLSGRTLLAHRWIWETLFGPIPVDMVVNHKCGNKKCINPTHLEIVSQAENCRHGKGTKLTKFQAKVIKRLKPYKRVGITHRLAHRYNVSTQLIHDIWNGRAWKEL